MARHNDGMLHSQSYTQELMRQPPAHHSDDTIYECVDAYRPVDQPGCRTLPLHSLTPLTHRLSQSHVHLEPAHTPIGPSTSTHSAQGINHYTRMFNASLFAGSGHTTMSSISPQSNGADVLPPSALSHHQRSVFLHQGHRGVLKSSAHAYATSIRVQITSVSSLGERRHLAPLGTTRGECATNACESNIHTCGHHYRRAHTYSLSVDPRHAVA